jgi:FkbM family methyltransferase
VKVEAMPYIVQIGAGAGADHATKLYQDGAKMLFVEANPLHINALRSQYPDSQIKNVAIVPSLIAGEPITMYYSTLDGPDYEVTSTLQSHVLKHHYPQESIKSFTCETMTLSELLDEVNSPLFALLLDIEGVDEDVLLDTNLSNYDIANIQVELLHIRDMQALTAHMAHHGYVITNKSFDPKGYDRIFTRITQ